MGAALTEPNDFIIRVLHRYSLDKWAEATYEETRSPSTDELSKLTVTLAEELLHLFIIVIGAFVDCILYVVNCLCNA